MGFEKGNRANPGGRPKKTDEQIKFERQCREWASLFALDKLKRTADGENPTASLAATREILDRGFGKSVETSVIDAYVAPATGSSVEDLAGELGSLIPGEKAESGGPDKPDQVEPGT